MARPRKNEPPIRLTKRGYFVLGALWAASFIAAMATANIGLPGWSQ